MSMDATLTMIMAGGQGERLYPLTKSKAKPAVTFGGNYRIIDFTLSNCINTGIRRIYLLTQYSNATLDDHMQRGWSIFNHELGEFVRNLPPQKVHMDSWYRGTADSIFQNLGLIEANRPEHVLILSGDHVYKMDYRKMIRFHQEREADATLACVALPVSECHHMGVIQVDDRFRVIGFQEKPRRPRPMPTDPTRALANMGVYVFKTESLVRALVYNARRDTNHDFGKDIIPLLIKNNPVYAYTFRSEGCGESNYWRDVGNITAFYATHQELLQEHPPFNLHEEEWPVRTFQEQAPPAKIINSKASAEGKKGNKEGMINNALLCNGCVITDGYVHDSILSPFVRVEPSAVVDHSILMKGVSVGEHARLRKTVVDEGIVIPAHYSIGYDADEDRRRFTVSETGVVVVPQGCILD